MQTVTGDPADPADGLAGVYLSAADTILTAITATQPRAEFQRYLNTVTPILSALPVSSVAETLEQRASKVETAIPALLAVNQNATDLREDFAELSEDIRRLRVTLLRHARRVRQDFRDRIVNRIDRGLPLLSFDDVELRLNNLNTTLKTTLKLGEPDATPPQFGNPLEDFVEPVNVELDPNHTSHTSEITLQMIVDSGTLPPSEQTSLITMLGDFDLAIRQVAGEVGTSAGPQTPVVTPDIVGLLRQFATGIGTPGRSRALRDFQQIFNSGSDTILQLLQTLKPELRSILYEVWRNLANELGIPYPEVHVLRKRVSLFGYNAPKVLKRRPDVITDLQANIDTGVAPPLAAGQKTTIDANIESELDDVRDFVSLEEPTVVTDGDFPEEENKVFLDSAYEDVLPGSFVVIDAPDEEPVVLTVRELISHPRTAYGVSTTTTAATLSQEWWSPTDADAFDVIRGTVLYVESEQLALAEEPILDDLPTSEARNEIELSALYDGLDGVRSMIVSGERTDIPGAKGVLGVELIEVIGVVQSLNDALAGDRIHTKLILAEELKHSYKRDTVKIHGNVINATHGKTQQEVLGSGNASQAFQRFELSSAPLTYLPAVTPTGAQSTLSVRVNDVQWRLSDGLAGLGPTDHSFVTETDNDQNTAVTFGDGRHGSRLPTGFENVTAEYRTGIGKSGNVKADQISQLSGRPSGLKGVINPLRSSGGADPETRDQARSNAPLPVMALDRLVSVQDYADFSRTFAGIGKSIAARLSDGKRELIHVTIAGADDIPIDPNSDLLASLRLAVRQAGDPARAIQIQPRELKLLIVDARVRVRSNYQFESVEPKIRSALLDAFSFENAGFAQDITGSAVIAVIERVAGVEYIDLNKLDAVEETIDPAEIAGLTCRLTLNPSVNVKRARTRETFQRRINPHCTVAQFINAYAISAFKDPEDPTRDKSALDVLKDLNPSTLGNLEASDLEKTFAQLSAKIPLDSVLTVKPPKSGIHPAQLAYLSPDVPDTLILSEIR